MSLIILLYFLQAQHRLYYAHHQELATIMLITTLVISFLVCCRLEVILGSFYSIEEFCGWTSNRNLYASYF